MIRGSQNLKRAVFIISIIFFIALMPLVSSVPPVQTTIIAPEGLEIEATNFEYLQQNTYHNFRFRVYNATNNIFLNDTHINCSVGFIDNQGEYLFQQPVVSATGYVFSVNLSKGNFSKIGIYHQGINCITDDGITAGGVKTLSFEVTPNGDSINTGISLIYFIVTLFAFGIFFLITWLFLNINGENPKDETGYIGINYRKYVKTALFPLVYVTFLWFFNFIIGLSNNYLGLTLYSNTLGFIFMVLTKLVYPVIVLCFIIAIVLMIKDSNIEKEYKSLWSRY